MVADRWDHKPVAYPGSVATSKCMECRHDLIRVYDRSRPVSKRAYWRHPKRMPKKEA